MYNFNANFLTGALVGGVIGIVASNPETRKAILKTTAKGINLVTNTLAEAKEKFADAQAEVELEVAKQGE